MEKTLPFSLTVISTIMVILASKLANDSVFLTCVSIYGSNDTGCSVSGRCCSSMSAIVKDLKNNCLILSHSTKVTIEIISDLTLNDTVQFGNWCGNLLTLEIKGNNFTINCSKNIQESRKDSGSGLYFKRLQGLSLLDMTFFGCGSLQTSTSQNVSNTANLTTFLFPTTLYLLNCSNVHLTNITIHNSHGTAVAIFDSVGEVKIRNCSFENNQVRSPLYPGGGGLYIEVTNCTPGHFGDCYHVESSSYTIQDCLFKNNNASLLYEANTSYIPSTSNFQGMGKGGGMAVYINGNNKNCSVQVSGCTFLGNSAAFGGGLYLQFRDRSAYNSISVENCNFTENKSYKYGGGGLCGGYVISPKNSINSISNTMNIINCTFENNSTKGNGGGISLFTTKGSSFNFSMTNKIYLKNCLWRNNTAFVASALDLAPEVYSRLGSYSGLLPTPTIDNCTFDSNFITNNIISESSNDPYFNASESGLATVYISGYQVNFLQNITFINNTGTGLYLSLASIIVTSGSKLFFRENHGKYGGGLTITAFSVLTIQNNSSLLFTNNTSATKGGAILVQSTDNQHEKYFSHSCFIRFQDNQETVNFIFKNNFAKSGVGHNLFATFSEPCKEENYLFETITDLDNQTLAYSATRFQYDSSSPGQIFPGVEFTLKLSAFDELNHAQNIVYGAFMTDPLSNIKVDPAYSQVSNNAIKLYGKSSSNSDILALETDSATLNIRLHLSDCPPGFHNDEGSCRCAAKFEGRVKCGSNSSYSHIVRGSWLGQCNGSMCTAHCPPGYCSYNNNNYELIKLPSSWINLSDFVCDKYRKGILCNQCKNNTSVYYHSHYYRCQPNRYCSVGVIFYLLSEILPSTIFFLVVTIFNINLTSGTANGFVLFAQIADTIDVSAQGSIEFPGTAKKLSFPYKLIYRMFNFDFFSLESLSFCLWESATALDMMATKYVTITFTLCLVLLTILFLNSWKCKRICVWFRPRSLRTALTHGFTTLLVICFSQCARVSFLILSHTEILHYDYQETVVFYNGALHPFHTGHVQYAVPALFFLIIVVLIPLVWLLLYPLLFNVLGMCHLSESRVSLFLSKFFPIGLLDSFQGHFKDNCRCFAGLYFFYRLLPLILSIIIRHHIAFYTSTSLQFVGMIALHSAFQPYKDRFHNLNDTFIFIYLLVVNLLTAYNCGMVYSETRFPNEHKTLVIYIQLVLMYLPMVHILLLYAIKVYKKVKRCYMGYLKIEESFEDFSQFHEDPNRDSVNSM